MAAQPQLPFVASDSNRLYPPGTNLYVERRLVGPLFALSVLNTRNTRNRKLSDSTVKDYAGQMKRGEWKLTPQGIAFDTDGILIDGQHRLYAVIESNTSVELLITWNADPEARKVVDGGRKRAVGDQMTMLLPDLTDGRFHAATYVVVRDLRRGSLVCDTAGARAFHFADGEWLHAELQPWMAKIGEAVGVAGMKKLGGKVIGALVWALALSSERRPINFEEHVIPLMRGALLGEGLKIGDPAYYLREALFGARHKPQATIEAVERKVLITLCCLRATMKGDQVKKVAPADYGVDTDARRDLFHFFMPPGSARKS